MTKFISLTRLYSNGLNPNILGRDLDIEKVLLTLLRYEKPNVLLVGEPGVGKTALVHQLAYLIANALCTPELRGYEILEVYTNDLLSGEGYRGVTEQRFEDLITEAKKGGKTITYFDEFHTVQNLGRMSNNSTPGLGNALKPHLLDGSMRVIGSTTNEELRQLTDKALLRRFSIINVGEPSEEACKVIINNCLLRYATNAGIKELGIESGAVDKIYDYSLQLQGYNPDKVKDIVDIVVASLRLHSRTNITLKFLSDVYDKYFLMREKPVEGVAVKIIIPEKEDIKE